MRPPLVVGLTGGIGSGKTTVAGLFSQAGVPVIDADELARELVAPGQPAFDQIVSEFGMDLVTPSGALDRPRLRALVFRNPTKRKRLEAILHPRIRCEMERRLSATRASYCLLVIPLLFETGQAELVDRVLVVDAPREQQIRRTQDRDGVTRKSVEGILRTQLGRRARLKRADDLIRNDSDLAHLGQQVQTLHRCYLECSGGDLPGTNG